MPAAGSLPNAVDTKMRSPQTIGLDTETPAIGVFHNTFSPVAASHFTGIGVPSATPDAAGPRNMGQFCADATAPAVSQQTRAIKERWRVIFFTLRWGPTPSAYHAS